MLTNHYRTRDYRVARSLTDAFGPYAQLSVEKRRKLTERMLDVLCMLCFGIGAGTAMYLVLAFWVGPKP